MLALVLALCGCQSQPVAERSEPKSATGTRTTITTVTIKPSPGTSAERPQGLFSASLVVNENGKESRYDFPVIQVNLYPGENQTCIKPGECTLENRSKDNSSKHTLKVIPQQTAEGLAYTIEVTERKPMAGR